MHAPNSSTVQVSPLTDSDADRALAVDLAAFFFDPTGSDAATELAHFDWDRTFGATRGDQDDLVGLYTSYDMGLTVPGTVGGLTRVPMAGLSWVSVHPDQRRRGVLREMVRHHFADLHRSGSAAISGLHAAEVPIYGRFGYGVASLAVSLTLARGATLTAPALDARAARVQTAFVAADSDEAAARLHEVHLMVAPQVLGATTRPDRMARTMHVDIPANRLGREPTQVMFASVDGRTTGYALFHRKQVWEHGTAASTVSVPEIAAADPPSLLALARRMVDFDLTVRTEIGARGMDDPILWWAGGPRVARVRTCDSLWVRLVDLDRALTGRGYAGASDVVLDVVDEVCPWNHGRWRLRVGDDGAATCSASTADPDVRLPVQALGAAYLGSRTLLSQAGQGLVEELRPGSLRLLSRAMSADREPVGAVEF